MQRRLDEIQKFTESHGWSRMSKWISQNDVSVRVKHNMSGADGRLIRNKDKSIKEMQIMYTSMFNGNRDIKTIVHETVHAMKGGEFQAWGAVVKAGLMDRKELEYLWYRNDYIDKEHGFWRDYLMEGAPEHFNTSGKHASEVVDEMIYYGSKYLFGD